MVSVDVENGFTPEYVIPSDKKRVVSDLKRAAGAATTVWLASDEDREGEAISWHLFETLGLKKENTHRIAFHEITKDAILNAVQNPRDIDMNIVTAQQARRGLSFPPCCGGKSSRNFPLAGSSLWPSGLWSRGRER